MQHVRETATGQSICPIIDGRHLTRGNGRGGKKIGVADRSERNLGSEAETANADTLRIDLLHCNEPIDHHVDIRDAERLRRRVSRPGRGTPPVHAKHGDAMLDEREHRYFVSDTAFQETAAIIILNDGGKRTSHAGGAK